MIRIFIFVSVLCACVVSYSDASLLVFANVHLSPRHSHYVRVPLSFVLDYACANRTHVATLSVWSGMKNGRYNAVRISRRGHHAVWYGDGAYASKTFIWSEMCSSGFPPHPGPPRTDINPCSTALVRTSHPSPNPINGTDVSMSTMTHNFLSQWSLRDLEHINATWLSQTVALLHNVRICVFCGLSHFHDTKKVVMRTFPVDSPFPFLRGAPHMAEYALAGYNPDRSTVDAYVCANRAMCDKWRAYIVDHDVACSSYTRILLSVHDLLVWQTLSFLDVSLNFRDSYMGYARATLSHEPLLHAGVIQWGTNHVTNEYTVYLCRKILRVNRRHNPLYGAFTCLYEVNVEGQNNGVSCLPSSVVAGIVQTHVDNAPTLWDEESNGPRPYTMSTFVPAQCQVTTKDPLRKLFHVGSCTRRNEDESAPLLCDNRTMCTANTMPFTFANTPTISVECALFPFLFPTGTGYYNGEHDFHEYLRLRMLTWLSPFTLYTPYVLLMAQVKQSILLLNGVSQVALERDLARFRQTNPDTTQRDALMHVAKHTVPASIPNSPMYHRSQLRNLLAMVDAYGMPNFFLTLTADEVSELRWPEYNVLETQLETIFDSQNFTWKDAPVECTRLFRMRVDAFMTKHILNKKKGILGTVLHYLLRYEFQDRGSPHVHIILWIDTAHEDRVTQEIIAYIPAAYNTDSGEFVSPENPIMRRLFEIVMRKQQHRCHAIGRGCRKHGTCQQRFPFKPNEGGSMYDGSINRWVYARPFVGSTNGADSVNRNVVPYHPVVSLLWNAHANLLRITAEAWSFYVLKYATKMEPTGFLRLDTTLAEKLQFSNVASEAHLKLITGMVLQKPLAPTECAFAMLKYPVITFSNTCHFVNSSPPDLRARTVLRAASVCVPPVEVYCARPASMVDVTFTDFYKLYTMQKKKLKTKSFVGVTTFGDHIYAAPADYLVRFTDFHPSYQPEAYAYNVLLRNIPFTRETDLLSPDNNARSYVRELVLRGIIRDFNSIESLADDYARYHLYTDQARTALYDALMVDTQNWDVPGFSSDSLENVSTALAIPVLRANIERAYADPNETSHAPFIGPIAAPIRLTADQEVILNRFLNPNTSGLHLLSGSPGAGKTFVTKLLIDRLSESGRKVVLCATTGVAATRLHADARTVHATFAIPVKNFLSPISPTHPNFSKLRDANVIIIDECSMMTAPLLSAILHRLTQVTESADYTVALRSKLVLLVGDFCQLPPVCAHRVLPHEVCRACHVSSAHIWPSVEKHHLASSYRHAKDPIFSEFLNRIRHDTMAQADLDAVLSVCTITTDDVYPLLGDDCTVLCSHNHRADTYNNMALRKLFDPSDIQTVIASGAPPPNVTSADLEWYNTWLADPNFHRLSEVALGSRVMLTCNMKSLQKGVNGDIGTVTAFSDDTTSLISIKIIYVRLDRTTEVVAIYRSTTTSTWRNSVMFRKNTFPLTLAYAITAHKSQGATLAHTTVVHMDDSFAPGLMYVMFSRVTERRFLKLVGGIRAEDIIPIPKYIADLMR